MLKRSNNFTTKKVIVKMRFSSDLQSELHKGFMYNNKHLQGKSIYEYHTYDSTQCVSPDMSRKQLTEDLILCFYYI